MSARVREYCLSYIFILHESQSSFYGEFSVEFAKVGDKFQHHHFFVPGTIKTGEITMER